jgi:hypothetical protein
MDTPKRATAYKCVVFPWGLRRRKLFILKGLGEDIQVPEFRTLFG